VISSSEALKEIVEGLLGPGEISFADRKILCGSAEEIVKH